MVFALICVSRFFCLTKVCKFTLNFSSCFSLLFANLKNVLSKTGRMETNQLRVCFSFLQKKKHTHLSMYCAIHDFIILPAIKCCAYVSAFRTYFTYRRQAHNEIEAAIWTTGVKLKLLTSFCERWMLHYT